MTKLFSFNIRTGNLKGMNRHILNFHDKDRSDSLDARTWLALYPGIDIFVMLGYWRHWLIQLRKLEEPNATLQPDTLYYCHFWNDWPTVWSFAGERYQRIAEILQNDWRGVLNFQRDRSGFQWFMMTFSERTNDWRPLTVNGEVVLWWVQIINLGCFWVRIEIVGRASVGSCAFSFLEMLTITAIS